MIPTLRTLLPMACDGVGPSYTCVNLLRGLMNAGMPCDLIVNRHRMSLNGIPHHSIVPRALSYLPYNLIGTRATRLAERRFIRNLQTNDAAYLWPSVSLETYHCAVERGVPVVVECINTRMASARIVLERAYESLGLPPGHGITDSRIADEEEKLACASVAFAPSPGVEASLANLPQQCRLVPASYGVALDRHFAPLKPPRKGSVKVLFVGYVCVRKGAHLLLTAWEKAGIQGELILVGRVEQAIEKKFAHILNRSDVRVMGFRRNVSHFYNLADIFVQVSLEEGDPLVTYEAAAHGLPLITSPMGAGRIGTDTSCTVMVNLAEQESLTQSLRRLAGDPEARNEWGSRAHRAVQGYDWMAVGRRRAELLKNVLASLGQLPVSQPPRSGPT